MSLYGVKVDVGFTGTSNIKKLTPIQKRKFIDVLNGINARSLSHGDCVAADKYADNIAKQLDISTRCYPPENDKKRAFTRKHYYVHEELSYLERNHLIAEYCDVLIALPQSEHEIIRSGTWATIRHARKLNKSIIIITPKGKVCYE